MAELDITNALAGVSPMEVHGATMMVAGLGPKTLIMPFKGKTGAVSSALEAGIGIALPPIGQSVTAGEVRLTWFGKEAWLLTGAPFETDLSGIAAVTDQSDGWVAVTLDGASAADILARLTPIDLRLTAFPAGATARTDLQHMPASITRVAETRFLILTFRSMAQTLWHDLAYAMQGVAARHTG